MQYTHIFTPITLGKLLLPNRIYSTAHAEVYADAGGMPGERYIKYYEEKAKGGLGMAICCGSSPVSLDVPQSAWKPVNLTTDLVIGPLAKLAEAMHKHGSKIMIQATHMGRRSAFTVTRGRIWCHPAAYVSQCIAVMPKPLKLKKSRALLATFPKQPSVYKQLG